ncbi:TlpA family protein disulfide reductase [Pelobacter seleniigenes]|uniref:TlpA family protein disulfide reductase n=1 Tax=Pelobacter seleniigenes TaxID=407188 RepID=UPI0004A71C0F|nr:TlpA disulfide reductase family protein [Pelobacter seleniigenes]
MPGRQKIIILVLHLLLLLPSLALALRQGDQFPALTGKLLSGGDFEFKQLEGKPILIKIGTTWCPACEEQSADIKKLDTFLDQHQIQYVEVFVQESAATVERFLNHQKYRSPDVAVLDSGTIARELNIYTIPRVILVDKNFLVARDGAPLGDKALKTQLQQMLTGK